MKLKAYDNVREEYISPEDFALTGDGHILIAKDETHRLLGFKEFAGFWPNVDVPDESVTITVED